MEERYKIGKHTFETKKDYENALNDVKKIRAIVEQIDIDEPQDVLRLYHLLREGKITFKSELGAAFFCDISDRVAQNSHEFLEEKQDTPKKRKVFFYKIIGMICLVVAIICFSVYEYLEYREKQSARELEMLQEQKSISQAVDWYVERLRQKETEKETEKENGSADTVNTADSSSDTHAADTISAPAETVTEVPKVLSEYEALKKQYENLVGWIRIEDTQINLPVMQTADNEYYLHRNIDGEDDVNGTLFLDYRDELLQPSTNLIIYGHNMKSGAMFGGLKKYLDEGYLAEHDIVFFDTIYEKQTYQIVAVCLSEVGYQDDNSYHYYDFIQAEDKEEFRAFLEEIRKCAVYDNTQDVTESDSLLTLSTCNSYVEDGRLFVVAKKI